MPPDPCETMFYKPLPMRIGEWLLLLMFVAALASCQRAPPEQRLREAVQSLQEILQRGDAASLDDWLAADFIGPGGLDRDGARRLAQVMHLRHRNIDVALGPMQVRLQPAHATVEFTTVITGGSGGLLPDSGQVFNVTTGWRMDANQWRLTSARWVVATE
ncbi:MAG TPA: nuclear transport factor 2 family protein [Lysobacter sp.]|nr:nuclear transport factor 2 family protein [Lysobacter sp.]